MGRLSIPDPRNVPDAPRGQYDISSSLIVRRSREIHREERIRSIKRAVRWLLVGALCIAAGRSIFLAVGEKYGYLEPENPPSAVDASLSDLDSDSEESVPPQDPDGCVTLSREEQLASKLCAPHVTKVRDDSL